MSESPLISIVSPVYACSHCLEALVDAVREAFVDSGLDWELVCVDDRGPDQPWTLIRELAARDARVRGVRLSRNHGQQLAIWAGFEVARGDWVAVMDCDLQDDPAVIPALYRAAVERQVDAMIVERGSWSDSLLRRTASKLFYWSLNQLAGVHLRNIGNFGLYSRRMVNTLLQFGEQEVFLPLMVTLTGLSTSEMRLDRSDRLAGRSSYSLSHLIRLATTIIIRFSDRPLKLSIVIGLLLSAMAAIISVILLSGWLAGAFTVPGWTSSMLSIWFFSGIILAVLGVHGFYIGRVFAEVKQRPRIVVEEVLGESVEPHLPYSGSASR